MAENVLERLKRIDADKRIADFNVKMKMDYSFKRKYAAIRVHEFIRECGKRDLNYHVSVGGLDSITLLLFIRSLGYTNVPAISVSSLEDLSIQRVHTKLGIEKLKPAVKYVDDNGVVHRWSKPIIIQEFGFPVLSKEIAAKIDLLQNPSEKNVTVRHAIITGETGAYGGWQKNSRMKLSQKWLNLFGGYENETEGTNYQTPPFKVSSKCCYYLKEKPCDDWAKEHNSVPFLGMMASEGGRRAKVLKLNGCNYFGKSTIRSAPFAIFNRQDILKLALELNVPVPTIYGEIAQAADGTLYTTKAQRTGCAMCGFGIHMEKRPNRFDIRYKENPKEWDYWMFHCCKDENGNEYGWKKVLDYIGVDYRPYDMNGELLEEYSGQMSIKDFLKEVTI